MKSNVVSRCCAVLIACLVAAMVAFPVMALAALETNFDWYRGHEADASYAIGTAGEMKALAQLVNGTADYDGDGTPDVEAVDFAGKTITLDGVASTAAHSVNFLTESIEPIGTQDHPFKGAFDGNGWTVDNFTYSVSAKDSAKAVRNVGLFGYIGEGGSVSNLDIGSLASVSIVRGSTSSDYVVNVGMLAGYCAGSISNCANHGVLSISSEVAQASASDYMPVRNVGGVAGQCVFDVTGCSNSGSVSITQNASPDPDIAHGQLVARVGGVVGLAGDESRIGTYDKHIFGESDKHGAVSDCSNTGTVFIDTPQIGVLDRFGQQTNAESWAVGGVVGYSQGSVSGCVNGRGKAPEMGASDRDAGYVRAENGVQVGGVCGSLRGVLSDNMNVAWADDGADGADPLVMVDCTNYGDVYARATVGGVVGKTSSYTTLAECLNLNKSDYFGNVVDSFVIATRWNKPAPGGVVGTASGEVSYCANLATVASALWDDEAKRTLKTQDGYYAAGIAGMLVYFGADAPSHKGITTPVSELFGCYNAGTIVAGSGMRQRGIVGQNDGYVHDNALLEGVVDEDKIVYGDSAGDKEASGTTGVNKVFKTSELRGDDSAAAVAFLNTNSAANGWERYWVVSRDAQAKGLNDGFPLLDRQDPWGDVKESIAGASLTLTKDAAYTGDASIPEVAVMLNGMELTANVDYHVVPQAGAINPSGGERPYRASVEGLGRYAGTSDASVAYGITAGDFSSCIVTVASHVFDYSAQVPSDSDVVVRTPAGTAVASGEYTFAVVDSDGNQMEVVNANTYRLLVKPVEGSTLFTGELEGKFVIKPASFTQEVDFDKAEISYLGESYKWVDSTEKGESDNPTTTLPYTSVSVQPEVSGITYKGHTLVEGTDYKVIYGNPSSDDGNTNSDDFDNRGKAGGTTKGCVTVRYLTGAKTNFSSYANMFFNITDSGSKTDLAKATYSVEGVQVADGKPLTPVELYLGRSKLTEGVDYTIAYSDNVDPGTATFTATGKGSFTGTLSGEFEIESGELVSVLYAYSGDGTTASPFEATVTGVEYHGNRDTFSLVIPDAAEHDGATYAVTAVGERAFGGAGSADFTGSLAAESKEKLASVYIPASVRSLGDFAFGSAWASSDLALASVEFAEGSQLTDIGMRAFSRCGKLTSITVPAKVATIGRNAFRESGLSEMRFLTTSSKLPSEVTEGAVQGAFRDCDGVTVYGYASAKAVKALAEANAGTSSGTHGGTNFTFKQISSMQSAVVSNIAAQTYTGDAIEPSVSVKLSGKALTKGKDYAVVYANNVNAGTARVIVKGIGTWGGQIEKTFAIEPAKMTKVEMPALEDKPYDGKAASYSPRLTYSEHRLTEGVDYALSYADGSGNAIDAPTEPGTYRLVAKAIGSNFTGSRYRSFRITAADLADAVVDAIGQQDYTGTPVKPSPNIAVGGKYLTRDVDYVLSYSDNVVPGTATMRVRGIGEYEGEQSVQFRIVGTSLAGASIAGVSSVKATGAAVAFSPVVVAGGRQLVEGDDYTVSYKQVTEKVTGASAVSARAGGALAATSLVAATAETDLDSAPSAVGSYKLVVTGKGNCRGTTSVAFDIVEGDVAARTDLSGATVEVAGSPVAYDGSALTPNVKVTLDGNELAKGTDYIVAYADNVLPTQDSARARVTVFGTGDYEGSASGAFEISSVALTEGDIADITGAYYQAGAKVEPAVAVVVNGKSLAEGTDYTVGYSNNTGVGQAVATVTGLNGYASAPVEKAFAIAKADLSRATVQVEGQVYSGVALKPSPVVTMKGDVLVAGRDYDVTYEDNTAAGNAVAIISGAGNYTGSLFAPFAIAQRPIDGSDGRVIVSAQTYTGSALKPNVTVRVGSTVLGASDYTVSYSNNVNVGTGKVKVTAKGNYKGSVTQGFVINAADLSSATVSVASATYAGGAALKPAVTVKLGGKTLKSGTDYSVSYSGNTKAGTGKAKVTGKGNYQGSVSKSFKIAAASLAKATVSVASATYAGGAALKPAVTVKLGGKTLKSGTDYSVAYSGNTKAGTGKATVTGKGNYQGSVSKSFAIAKAGNPMKVSVSAKAAKFKKLKKAQTVAPISVSKAQGSVSYKKTSGSKELSVNAKTGKVTVKKKAKKGTYKVTVKVSAAGNGNYKPGAATVSVTVKVK